MSSATLRSVELPSGEIVPALGLGTWHMGENPTHRKSEIAAIRLHLDLGLTLIDTAELYGEGGAEELVGEAIAGRRDEVFLVSKVLPHHATRLGAVVACENSLRRLKTEQLDLYLLHWREKVPLEETLEAFAALIDAVKIRQWGVSNFDISDMRDLFALSGGSNVATDQVLFNLTRRGIEFDLLPWCQQRQIPVTAYSPIEQGRLLDQTVLESIAVRHRATPAQVALAWVLGHDRVFAIPKAGTPAHVRQNHGALEVHLTKEDTAALDREFPPPTKPRPLEML